MPEILAENLSGKSVTGSDGAEIGMLYNITMDLKSGALKELVVDPMENVRDANFRTDDMGNYRIPVGNVTAVKDHVIVSR